MAKGLGAMLAQIEIDRERARLAHGDAVACPFCGREMDNAGIAYFCYGGPPHEEKCSKLPKLEDELGGEWNAQGTVVAAVVRDKAIVAECRIVRGGGGRSNLSITSERELRDQVPQLIARYGWTYLDEVYHLSEAQDVQ